MLLLLFFKWCSRVTAFLDGTDLVDLSTALNLFLLFDLNSLHFSFCSFNVWFCFALSQFKYFLLYSSLETIKLLNLITVILNDRRDNNATQEGDNCGNGHFWISCLFRGCYRMLYWNFSSLLESGALNRFRHLRFSCLIWLINESLSTSPMELFFSFSFRRRGLLLHARNRTNKFDTLRSCSFPAGYYCAGYTFYIFLAVVLAVRDRKSIVGTAFRARNARFSLLHWTSRGLHRKKNKTNSKRIKQLFINLCPCVVCRF